MGRKYPEREIEIITNRLLEELREVHDGTETCTVQLLHDAGYETGEYAETDLPEIHDLLVRAAEENGIRLDMAAGGCPPWQKHYAVFNREAQIKCPHCGSRHTARIVYGLPDINERIRQKLDEGRIRFGGCLIGSVKLMDEHVGIMPERYCNTCEREFASTPAVMDRKTGKKLLYTGLLTSVSFSKQCVTSGRTVITVRKTDAGAVIESSSGSKQIADTEWEKFMEVLFERLYLHEWKHVYDDPHSAYDLQWKAELDLGEGKKRCFFGYNKVPPYWEELNSLFDRL